MDRRFYKAVLLGFALLFLLGVGITLAQTVAVQPRRESPTSNGSDASHFINPPTYDSGWLNITDKRGEYFDVVHNLNTTDVFVEIEGKQYSGEVGGHQINLGSANILPSWNKTFDESGYGPWILKTSDGGYAFSGYLKLYKVDADGKLEWNRTYIDYTDGSINSITSTSDGGYALAGTDWDGHAWDFWIAKTNSTGDLQWSETYDLFGVSEAWGLTETGDGGYAIAGYHDTRARLIKTNATGGVEWTKEFNNTICAYSIVENTDGSLVMACESYGVTPLLVKVDSSGNQQWNMTYSTCLYPHLVKTSDGGYAIAGSSIGAGYEANLIKTDENGTVQWEHIYGGANDDCAHTLIQTSDNGYAIVGMTESFGAGGSDIWLIKADQLGNHQWNRTYGGFGDEMGFSIIETTDGRYLIGGDLTSHGAPGIILKTELETGTTGISRTGLTNSTLKLYRGSEDPYWNYIRVRVWEVKEPTWTYGDIDMDGDVDIFDLVRIAGNYGQTFYGAITITGSLGLVALGTARKLRSRENP